MVDKCCCGHVRDEHLHRGEDKKAPNSQACTIDGCDCIHFEEDENAEDED